MQSTRILLIGLPEALKSTHAIKLRADFEKAGPCEFGSAVLPESEAASRGPASGESPDSFDVWIFLSTGREAPNYKMWTQYFGQLETKPQTAALTMKPLPPTVMVDLQIQNILLVSENSQKFIAKVLSGDSSVSDPARLTNRQATVSRTQIEPEGLGNDFDELLLGLDGEFSRSGHSKIEIPLLQQSEQDVPEADPSALLDAAFELSSAPTTPELNELAPPLENQLNDIDLPEAVASAEILEEAQGGDFDLPSNQEHDSNPFSGAHLGVSEATKAHTVLLKPMPEEFDDDEKTSLLNVKREDLDVSFSPTSIRNKTAMVEPNWAKDVPINSPKASGSEIETLQRYAALRERESREREATLQVLTKQMHQVKEKLHRSDEERRRLQLALEEARVLISTLEQFKDQSQIQTRKIEQQHQERQRGLQVKLDSAQFSANRSERKLEEFRERVRNDILRIRLRERELANKLELQKRDAESLLTAKDERLLAQKRELDRLEFDMEMLKERLIDDTQKAEERAEKLSKALQSLRMAQGMLSGIEEEVIPTSENRPADSGDGEDAA
jgi:hypothetical protein